MNTYRILFNPYQFVYFYGFFYLLKGSAAYDLNIQRSYICGLSLKYTAKSETKHIIDNFYSIKIDIQVFNKLSDLFCVNFNSNSSMT